MSIVADEIQTQPDLWRRAGALAADAALLLPARGERVCVVGCGTSADERSVVQTRFATTALSLLRALVDPESIEPAVADARRALSEPLPASRSEIEEWTFLARGWAAGLAFEAALKLGRRGGPALLPGRLIRGA